MWPARQVVHGGDDEMHTLINTIAFDPSVVKIRNRRRPRGRLKLLLVKRSNGHLRSQGGVVQVHIRQALEDVRARRIGHHLRGYSRG